SVFNVRRTPFFEVPDDYTTRLFSCQAFFCVFALFLKIFFTPRQSPIFRHKPPIIPDNSHPRRQNMRENASQFRNPKTRQDDSTRKSVKTTQPEKAPQYHKMKKEVMSLLNELSQRASSMRFLKELPQRASSKTLAREESARMGCNEARVKYGYDRTSCACVRVR
ncbi:MAG: hypothetical protein ILO53_08895, partial [Clostridia bacterium]|nr:hypothetical protein [Clostridia bacterium]